MATEASRSTVPSPESYVGSLISLTSKSDIRYEGIFVSIDTVEATIALRNVGSFGTEGRRKFGSQVCPLDRVFEYVVFKGSDIKDLQVKSPPPPPPPLYSDPAIIQFHYPQASNSSISLPSATVESASDISTQTSLPYPSRLTLPGGIPLYQPGELSTPHSIGSGHAVPIYAQGYYGTSNDLQSQEQTSLSLPPGFSMPLPVQQSVSYPNMTASLPTALSGSAAIQTLDTSARLIPPIVSGSLNMQSTLLPVQSLQPVSDVMKSSLPHYAPVLLSPSISQSSSLMLPPALDTAASNRSSASSLTFGQAKQVSSSVMPHSNLSVPMQAAVSSLSSASLVMPGQFLQPRTTTVVSSQSLQTMQKDVKVAQVPSSVSREPPPPTAAAVETPVLRDGQKPLLPLPLQSNQEPDGVASQYSHNFYINGGVRGRGRGSELSRSATSFSEDFDFEAMNEKFKKDEVWGHLGKSNAKFDNVEDLSHEAGFTNVEIKPVYKKDDFFDTLSSSYLDNGSQNGRTRFPEQMRRGTETLGDYSRYRGDRGPGHDGGRSRGGYYGRGYGYVGSGHGHNIYRAA